MAEEAQFSPDTATNKRKYEDSTPPSQSRRQTGFSAPIIPPPSDFSDAPASYNSVAPPTDEIQLAKQRAQEIAARLFNNASAGGGGAVDAKRARVDNGTGFDSADKGFGSAGDVKVHSSAIPVSYGYQGSNKKIEIPNGRVGVIIGKGGDTIKYLQLQSGAKIQVTRDMDADPNSLTRPVELMGTPEQIAKAEQLINEVLAEAEQGGSGVVSRRLTGQSGSEQFVMKVPDNKVGLVIGKGGETIKNMQARSGARIQVIPLHKPPGDMSTERTVQIDGSSEQIEAAKQLVNEVISENRLRNQGMAGGYPQQGYQARPPASWGPPGAPMQQTGFGYAQSGAYPGPSPQYNVTQPPYPGYLPPTSGGYSSNWDQSAAPPTQQTSQGGGYDYYSHQGPGQQQQTQGGPAPLGDNTGYNYSQPPVSGYNQQGQGYVQDGYGGYHAAQAQTSYGQPPYDQHQGYNSSTGYGNATNVPQEGHTPTYGSQGEATQAPPPAPQGYGTTQQPSPSPSSYPLQGSTQGGYGVAPTAHAGYGNPQSGYGPIYGAPPVQKPPVNGQQPHQSPSTPGSYGQSSVQTGYPQSQPPSSGYVQPDSSQQRGPPSSYGAAQMNYTAPPYGAPQAAPSGYGQVPPSYGSYASGYSQPPPVYAAEGNAGGSAPASQVVQQGGVAKASPKK